MASASEGGSDREHRIAKLNDWINSDPAPSRNFAETIRGLHEVRDLFLGEISERLRGPANNYLAQLPRDTAIAKSNICSFLNALLANFDCGVVDPKTNRVGILTADASHGNEVGRFRINVPDDSKTRRITPTSFAELQPLMFGPRQSHDVRQPWTEWIRSQSTGDKKR